MSSKTGAHTINNKVSKPRHIYNEYVVTTPVSNLATFNPVLVSTEERP